MILVCCERINSRRCCFLTSSAFLLYAKNSHFYRVALYGRGLSDRKAVRPSACPSVCPSVRHTRVYVTKLTKVLPTFLYHYERKIHLVF